MKLELKCEGSANGTCSHPKSTFAVETSSEAEIVIWMLAFHTAHEGHRMNVTVDGKKYTVL